MDDQRRQLEIEDRLLNEQQQRILIISANDDKPPTPSKVKTKKAVEIIDLTED